MEYISGDDELRRIAELREKYILDEESEREAVREEAREEGIKEGRLEAMRETAKQLLRLKIPLKQIMQITGLTKEEIENI